MLKLSLGGTTVNDFFTTESLTNFKIHYNNFLKSQIGEFANDYIEVRRDFDDWTPPSSLSKSWADRQKSEDTSSFDTRGPEYAVAAGDRHGHPDLSMHTNSFGQKYNVGVADGQRRGPEPIDEKPVAAGDRHGEPDHDIKNS